MLNGDLPWIQNLKRDSLIRLVYRKFSMALIDCEAFLERLKNCAISCEVYHCLLKVLRQQKGTDQAGARIPPR